jgi:hypothetical protein
MAKRATAVATTGGGDKPSIGDGFTEFGANGLKQYSGYVREEWLPQLIGRKGLLVLREMRDNDAIIGAIFFAIEMLLRGVAFHVEGASESPEDQAAADFIESCIGDMEQSWSGLLAEIMPFLLYGWDVHEIVYKLRKGHTNDLKTNSKYDDGMVGWRKLAIRSQETLLHWIFDEAGDATHLVQLLPTGGPLLQVPLDKCLHFRTTPYKGNPEGRSIIRNAYTSYYYKKVLQEIEAIGVSRDLTGLTTVWVPAKWTLKNASPEDKQAYAQAKTMARDIARNQQEGIVAPLMYDDAGNKTFDITLLATGGRRQFATNEIIGRYDTSMAMTVLADFLTLGTGGKSNQGTGAQSKNKTDIFSVAVVAFLDIVTAEFNRKAVPDLLYLNGMKGQANLVHGDIQRRNLQELGTFIQDSVLAGVLTPDPALEAHVREEGGLPAQQQDGMRDLGDGTDNKDGDSQDGEVNDDDDPADDSPTAPSQAQGAGGGGGNAKGANKGKPTAKGRARLAALAAKRKPRKALI